MQLQQLLICSPISIMQQGRNSYITVAYALCDVEKTVTLPAYRRFATWKKELYCSRIGSVQHIKQRFMKRCCRRIIKPRTDQVNVKHDLG